MWFCYILWPDTFLPPKTQTDAHPCFLLVFLFLNPVLPITDVIS